LYSVADVQFKLTHSLRVLFYIINVMDKSSCYWMNQNENKQIRES